MFSQAMGLIFKKRTSTSSSPSSSTGGSPNRTPTSSSSMQEMAFNFPNEKSGENVSMVQVPVAVNRRRRASMQDALDHTKINASLYEGLQLTKQDSIGSIQEENIGALNFSIDYNKEQALMTVRLIQGRGLIPKDQNGTASPYCKITLLPLQKQQLQSKVQKKTLSPDFQEEFVFEVLPSDISITTLQILVYDFDQFSCDECMGQILLPLDHVDFNEKMALWKGLSKVEKEEKKIIECGDLMFSLSFLPSAERLTVVVMKARNLHFSDDNKNTANPFVKVSLIYAGKRLKKKKTSSKRNTLNPMWNEALVFSLGKEFLNSLSLEFLILNDSLLGNSECFGKVIIGPNSSKEELAHWDDLVNSRNALGRWHKITASDANN